MTNAQSTLNDQQTYKVVINTEEQYSIWPERRDNPRGWTDVGVVGSKSDCLSRIDSLWTDMRPLSLRKAMEQPRAPLKAESVPGNAPVERLPVRLSQGPQKVELTLRPERTMEALARQVKTGYMHLRFTETRGGTELAIALEPTSAEQIENAIARGEKVMHVEGGVTLDYVPIRCRAEIDLPSFTGTCRVELVKA
jgi:uncharacterized protein YbdZ (MbtH family)